MQQARLLEKLGFKDMANALRRDFNRRVRENDPTTGVDFDS